MEPETFASLPIDEKLQELNKSNDDVSNRLLEHQRKDEEYQVRVTKFMAKIDYTLNGDGYSNGMKQDLKEMKVWWVLGKAAIAILTIASMLFTIYEAIKK